MIRDSKERYGSISRWLHWSMAILIGWQLFKFGDRVAEGEHWIGRTLVPWHVSIGVLLMLLVLLRIVWALGQHTHRPQHPTTTAFWIKSGHFLLYAVMALMPVTGTLVIVGAGYPVQAFGATLIPAAGEKAWASAIGELHSPLGWLLLFLVLGHIAIALLHHLVKRDDVLRRMAGR